MSNIQPVEALCSQIVMCATRIGEEAFVKSVLNEQTPSEVKIPKTVGGRSGQPIKNMTLITRMAHHLDVSSLNDAGQSVMNTYYKGNSGIKIDQFVGLQNICVEVCTHFMEKDVPTTANKMAQWLSQFVDSDDTTTEEVESQQALAFGSPQTEPVDWGFSPAPTATVTESSSDNDKREPILSGSFNQAMFDMLAEFDTPENRAKALSVIYGADKNGMVYHHPFKTQKKELLSVFKESNAYKWLKTDFKKMENAFMEMMRLRPKASAKWSWVDSDGKTHESTTKRGWLELFPNNDRNRSLYNEMVATRIVTYVVCHADWRETYKTRFAWYVTDGFVQSVLAFMGFNHELANSKVIGAPQNGAKNWLWELNHNDWSPSSSEKIDPTTVGFKMWN